MNQQRLTAILSGQDRTLLGKACRGSLAAAEPAYALAVAWRNRLFDWNLRSVQQLPRPTISVGNLTAGGTGKTPFVLELAERLNRLYAPPAVLLRGYKSHRGISDEAALMQQHLGEQIPVIAEPDRARAADRALKLQPGTRVFLLDDAFQHRQTRRHLDLVLIDATCPFGFGHLLPRGLLREPPASLRRASAIIITRADQVDDDALADLDDRIADLTGRLPIAHTAHRWTALRSPAGDKPVAELRHLTVAAVCGIANPAAFANMLDRVAARLLWCHALPDHHAPSRAQLATLLARAAGDGARALITTEKDWVKWQPLLDGQSPPLPILRPALSLSILDGEHAIHALLRKTVNALC